MGLCCCAPPMPVPTLQGRCLRSTTGILSAHYNRRRKMTERAEAIAAKIERFVRETVITYERDPRLTAHGPTEELFQEMRAKARAARLMTPHIVADGSHHSPRETAIVLQKYRSSTLGPVAVNTLTPE